MVDVNELAGGEEKGKFASDNVTAYRRPEPREDRPIVYCTPHEHHFRPDHEILRKKGHRSGGLASQMTFKYYEGKDHEPEEPYDYNKLMMHKPSHKKSLTKPAIKLKNKRPPLVKKVAPKPRTRSVPKVRQVGNEEEV